MNDKFTNPVSFGLMVSPVWLPSLDTISQNAALLLPILGVLWFAFQFYWKISGRDKRDD